VPPKLNGGIRGRLIITLVLLVLVVASFGAGMAFRFLYNMYRTLPSPSELGDIQPPLVSKVFAEDGSMVHEFSVERRFWVPLDQIPADLRNAVVAIEDRRFYKHWGIDVKRIVGATLVNIVRRGYAQGGSTITQQLARNVYLSLRQSLVRKVREAMTAVQIEHYYTKREILELYLNQVYLGAGVYGVEAASQRYFSKPVDELTLNECSLLAGLIQLPEYYRPDQTSQRSNQGDERDAFHRSRHGRGCHARHDSLLSPKTRNRCRPVFHGDGTAAY
jgi:penicillin-binding protein 1A